MKYNIEGNKSLKDIYDIKHKQCPPYLTNYIFSGMSTTQRSEAMNHLIKMCVKPSFILYEFVDSLDNVLLALWDKEILKDHEDTFAPPHIIINLPIESSLLQKYTFEVFALYQNQMKMDLNYFIQPVPNEMVWSLINLILYNKCIL